MSTTTTQYIRNLTVAEAAASMRCCDETLRRAIRAGAPHDRVGLGRRSPIRVSADELRAWFADQREAQLYTAYRVERDDDVVEYIRIPHQPGEDVQRQDLEGAWHSLYTGAERGIERIAEQIANEATVDAEQPVRIVRIDRL